MEEMQGCKYIFKKVDNLQAFKKKRIYKTKRHNF